MEIDDGPDGFSGRERMKRKALRALTGKYVV